MKSGSTETRVEKRIVITADSDADQEKVKTVLQECSQITGPVFYWSEE